jgi:hypothetical protein
MLLRLRAAGGFWRGRQTLYISGQGSEGKGLGKIAIEARLQEDEPGHPPWQATSRRIWLNRRLARLLLSCPTHDPRPGSSRSRKAAGGLWRNRPHGSASLPVHFRTCRGGLREKRGSSGKRPRSTWKWLAANGRRGGGLTCGLTARFRMILRHFDPWTASPAATVTHFDRKPAFIMACSPNSGKAAALRSHG